MPPMLRPAPADLPAPSQPGPDPGPAGAWRTASAAFRTAWNRLEPTLPGQVWKELSDLGFISNSLQFAAVFTLGFIPFLMVLLAVPPSPT